MRLKLQSWPGGQVARALVGSAVPDALAVTAAWLVLVSAPTGRSRAGGEENTLMGPRERNHGARPGSGESPDRLHSLCARITWAWSRLRTHVAENRSAACWKMRPGGRPDRFIGGTSMRSRIKSTAALAA